LSSILKALKKLENDHSDTDGQVFWPRKLGASKSIRRWEINSGRFAYVLWGLLAAIVLFAAGWFFMYMRQPEKSQTIAAMPEIQAVPSALSKKSPPAMKVDKPRPAARASAYRQTRYSAPGRTPKIRRTPHPSTAPVKTSKKLVSKKSATIRQTPSQPEAASNAGIPILTSDLKLQAISWSRNPANRIAVINGNILREGAALEGYSISRIAKDEVVVRKGAEEWKLVFNLK
jgi:hypothetical protein